LVLAAEEGVLLFCQRAAGGAAHLDPGGAVLSCGPLGLGDATDGGRWDGGGDVGL
jgi:hypothetical protein